MAITSELTGYKQRVGTLSRDSFLGTILMYAVKDCDIKHALVHEKLQAVGLANMTPRPPADSDKFCTAAQNGQRRQYAPDANGVIERLLVRHVTRVAPTKDGPRGKIVRKVVSEFVNPTELSLRYPSKGGGEITFWYDNGQVDIEAYDEATPNAIRLLEEVRRDYYAVRGTLDGSALRSIIVRALASAHAAAWCDAVAFVPVNYEATVEALESWAKIMREELGVPIEVDSFPLLNDLKQQAKVLDKARDDIKADVAKLQLEVQDAFGEESVTIRKATSINGRLQILLAKAKEYEALLSHETIVTDTALDVLETQVQKLYRRAA